jgi:hypothetical protein
MQKDAERFCRFENGCLALIIRLLLAKELRQQKTRCSRHCNCTRLLTEYMKRAQFEEDQS